MDRLLIARADPAACWVGYMEALSLPTERYVQPSKTELAFTLPAWSLRANEAPTARAFCDDQPQHETLLKAQHL